MRLSGAFTLALILAAGFSSCSQSISVPPPSVPSSAQDFFWQTAELSHGINYYVLRTGTGSDHPLSSTDGIHIEDGALSNEVTMVVRTSTDSVLVDSMGANSIFSLPAGYYFGPDSVSYVSVLDSVIRDTTIFQTTVTFDSSKDSMGHQKGWDTVSGDTTIPYWVTFDSLMPAPSAGHLLLLLRTAMDSGRSWRAGMLFGPGIPNGMMVNATVLDHVNSLHLPPVNASTDSSFGESFRIRYAPENFSDSASIFPIYWIAYFSRNTGPVLIQQYSNGVVTQSAQIIGQGP